MVIQIPSNAAFYKGSGHAVIAVSDGVVIDAIYNDDLMKEAGIKTGLMISHPGCRTAAAMMSCHEAVVYDASELLK